ncbi:hypothetical protein U9M48_035011 [Paspalum notatum var. saurae]|uniref:Uncharacterized protein n=1 Tax=Paspalum notatum var. saurae TaxID=547442 RepID=A0AAQ3UEY9_PASNO
MKWLSVGGSVVDGIQFFYHRLLLFLHHLHLLCGVSKIGLSLVDGNGD